jgi:hypothetical protein
VYKAKFCSISPTKKENLGKKKTNTRDREHTKSNSTTVEEVDPHGFTKVLINKEALVQFSECIFAAALAVELS